MATNPGGSRSSRRGERSERPINRGLRAKNTAHGTTISNDNSNVNNVYAPVQTIINSNPILNHYVVYGAVPKGSDEVQVTISTGLKARYVPQAVYDAQLGTGCMKGTRVKIINDIINWIKDPDGRKIFWLTGWAGSGKTAIAWTVCSLASEDPEIVLAGSFFCSRSASWAAQRDVRCVIPTLAQLLARQSSTFSKVLAGELARDPDVVHKHISVQIERLLCQPLRALAQSPVPVVFVIDALDECGGHSSGSGTLDNAETHRIVSEMLQALVTFCNTEDLLPVRFLVTSRPETHIRETPVADVEFSKVLRLQTVNKEQVTADIRFYITTKLLSTPKLREQFKNNDVDVLVRLCDDLFIVAITAVHYALSAGIDRAATRFKTLLNASQDGLSAGAAVPLDLMYALILEEAVMTDAAGVEELPKLLELLATLLCARMILSIASVSDLLDRPRTEVRAILSRLHAVVHVPDDDDEATLRTLHASFGDYVFHRAPDRFRIVESNGQGILARACLRVMAKRLCFNISQSRSSYKPNSPTKPETITLSLEYACTQWAYHIFILPEPSSLDKMLDEVFRRQFMFWLEVMSVLGQVHRATTMLHSAAAVVRSPELSRLFRDANFFVASSHEAIERSAPHIYLSALPFTTKDSLIYKIFAPLCTGILRVNVSGLNPNGGRLVMTLRGHEHCVTTVAYSPDGLLIASGSEDGTVRIWDTRNGEETTPPLFSGDKKVISVAIAPNGKSVASGTEAGTVCIWDNPCEQSVPLRLRGSLGAIVSVAFSQDSSRIASVTRNSLVYPPGLVYPQDIQANSIAHAWDIKTGQLLAVISGLGRLISAVAFSPDGQIMVSSSDWTVIEPEKTGLNAKPPFRFSHTGQSVVSVDGKKVLLWTRCGLSKWSAISLEGHTDTVRSAMFSPDGLYIASVSNDATVRIWDAGSGQGTRQPLPVATPQLLSAISISGAHIVSVLHDSSTRVWNPRTGETKLLRLEGHTSGVSSVAISSDGNMIATGCLDGIVRVWDAMTGAVLAVSPRYRGRSMVLAFAPDGRKLVSPSDDHGLILWDVVTGWKWVNTQSAVDKDTPIALSSNGLIAVSMVAIEYTLASALPIAFGHLVNVQISSSLGTSTGYTNDCIGFSPDGTHIVCDGKKPIWYEFGGTFHTTRQRLGHVWNCSTWEPVLNLQGDFSELRSLTYSPNGQLIAAVSDRTTTRLWNARTGECIVTLSGHRAPVEVVGFTAEGDRLVSGSSDGVLRIWDVGTASLMASKGDNGSAATLASAIPEDGWLKGLSGELLLWVPAEYHLYLQIPPHTLRLGECCVSIEIVDDCWYRGDTWDSCWRGDVSNAVLEIM